MTRLDNQRLELEDDEIPSYMRCLIHIRRGGGPLMMILGCSVSHVQGSL
jgi:hypothetical protein